MLNYTEADIVNGRISAEKSDLAYCPTEWQKMGLMETRTGYGARLNTGYKISFCGKLYRVYCTVYSNAGTCWFKVKGKKIIVY